MTRLLHISASPRGAASESLAIAEEFLAVVRDVRPESRSTPSTCGTARCPSSAPPPPAPRWPSSPARPRPASRPPPGRPRRSTFERFAAADEYLFTRADVEPRHPLHPQAVHRRRQPARHGLRLRPRPPATPACSPARRPPSSTPAPSTARAGRPSFGEDFQAPYLDSWLRWTGIDDITTIEFRPNLATADADSDRQRAHADARDAGKPF